MRYGLAQVAPPCCSATPACLCGPTAGRFFIDLTSGVTPQHFTKGEWFVGTAALTSIIYIALYELGLATPSVWPATLLAWAVGFGFRNLSLHFKWEEPEPWQQERLHVSQGPAPVEATAAK